MKTCDFFLSFKGDYSRRLLLVCVRVYIIRRYGYPSEPLCCGNTPLPMHIHIGQM